MKFIDDLKASFNCIVRDKHKIVLSKGYGYRCACCGKTIKQLKQNVIIEKWGK